MTTQNGTDKPPTPIAPRRLNMVEENAALRQEVNVLKADLLRVRNDLSRVTSQRNGTMQERAQMLGALTKFLPSGVAIDGTMEQKDPAWRNLVVLEMPAGQGFWHVHESELPLFKHLRPFSGQWDGHSFAEKYQRLNAIVAKGSIITL